MVVSVWVGEWRFWGMEGGSVSGARVRTASGGLGGDSLPPVSSAETWKTYSVSGASPVAV